MSILTVFVFYTWYIKESENSSSLECLGNKTIFMLRVFHC